MVGRFLNFKMVDSKTLISQAQELQMIFHEIKVEGMSSSESFQVTTTIKKLSLRWKWVKNYIKHKQKEMIVEDLIIKFHMEEDNKRSDEQGVY